MGKRIFPKKISNSRKSEIWLRSNIFPKESWSFLKLNKCQWDKLPFEKSFKFLKIINVSGTRYLSCRIFKFSIWINVSTILYLSNTMFKFLRNNKYQWDKVSVQPKSSNSSNNECHWDKVYFLQNLHILKK